MSMSAKVFISYSHKDVKYVELLQAHLSPLKREFIIETWFDRKIQAGDSWDKEIHSALVSADIILMMISADFLASDYCYDMEVKKALTMHDVGEAVVIPIILRPCDWLSAPFSKLQALPRDGKPLSSFSNIDEAFLQITLEIRRITKTVEHPEEIPATNVVEHRFGKKKNLSHKLDKDVGSNSIHWNLPHLQNPYFTGQTDILNEIQKTLKFNHTAALTQPLAICGLGGIGKTQTAVEFCYKYRMLYKGFFWICAESRESLISDFIGIANLLNLSIKDVKEQGEIIECVKNWFRNKPDMLLIFDNVNDLQLLKEFIVSNERSHIIITTRLQSVGTIANNININVMPEREGILFLLKRSKILSLNNQIEEASEVDREIAEKIYDEMGGLPLALDQAGAYIEETHSSLEEYLELYRIEGSKLRANRGEYSCTHPESVTTTFSISFKRFKEFPAAAELLYFCSFLSSDAIPEDIFKLEVKAYGDHLGSIVKDKYKFNEVIKKATRYSLIRRSPENKTLNMHRLVQAVLIDSMPEASKIFWAKNAYTALNLLFPEPAFKNWETCQNILPHVNVMLDQIIKYNLEIKPTAELLNSSGWYLSELGQYEMAEKYIIHAENIFKKCKDVSTEYIGNSLSKLGMLYHYQSRKQDAESTLKKSLNILKAELDENHPAVIGALNNLGVIYEAQSKYYKAEPIFKKCLKFYQNYTGLESTIVATCLNNLGFVYKSQGRLSEAEHFLIKGLDLRGKLLGEEHPDVAMSMNNVGSLYTYMGLYEKAEKLIQGSLNICIKSLGDSHPYVTKSLINLYILYLLQKRLKECEKVCDKLMSCFERESGKESLFFASFLDSYARILKTNIRKGKAKDIEAKAKAIWENHSQEEVESFKKEKAIKTSEKRFMNLYKNYNKI